jgi:alpha-1,2-mannosyltransferase
MIAPMGGAERAPSLPDWVFDRRRERIAWAIWGFVFAAFTLVSILRPGMRSVMHVYRNASNAWLAGREVYPEIDYPFPFVVLFTPFARMPVWLGEVLWRALQMGAYVTALWKLAKLVQTGPRRLFFWVSVLSLPAAFGSIKNGQTNLLVAAALAHAAVDWTRGRRVGTVVWLMIGLVAKPIAIVMILLLAAVDLPLVPGLLLGILVTAAFPLIFDSWPDLIHQYRAWFDQILALVPSPENRFDDINGIFRTLHVPIPTTGMVLLRLVAALATLVLWLLAFRRQSGTRRGLTLLGLSAAYLMLFNPRTESNGYVMLSHVVAAFSALVLVEEGRRIGWLLVGIDVGLGNAGYGKPIWPLTKIWLKPVLALVFFGFLISEIRRSGRDSAPSREVGKTAPETATV